MEEDNRSAVDSSECDVTSAETPEVVEDAQPAPETGRREQWAGEKAELEDLLRRRQAEFENFRRRIERERMEFAEYAGMESVRALLPILDDFERALKAAQAAGASDNELVKGIELIYKRLLEILDQTGIGADQHTKRQASIPICTRRFSAWSRRMLEDGAILEEYQRGYNFKGKLLRPSMVKVAVRS